MKCWICARQARAYGHSENRHRIGDPRRYPIDWVFCSRRCQDAFHQCYGAWRAALAQGLPGEAAMVDVTPLEQAAMRSCLKAFGTAASAIGFELALGAYSEAQALQVIEAIVGCYVSEMAAQHERSHYPAVRMPGRTPVRDPFQTPLQNSSQHSTQDSLQTSDPDLSDNPFEGMVGDQPWEDAP